MTSVALKKYDPTPQATPAPVPAAMDAEDTAWGEGQLVTLRRTGKQPMRFRGVQIAEATSHSTHGQIWFEVNIWRKARAGFVADIRVFKKGAGEKDVFHVFTAETVDEVLAWLEGFNPTHEVLAEINTGDTIASTGQLTLRAVALRQQLDQVERDYRALIGDLFFELGAAG